jgi:hypothetical protein
MKMLVMCWDKEGVVFFRGFCYTTIPPYKRIAFILIQEDGWGKKKSK